jgi:PKD repeat protein
LIQFANGKSFSAFAGQYKLFVERQGCVDSAVVAVTANDTEFPAGILTVNPISIPYGEQANLFADVVGADNYAWDLGDGNKINSRSQNIVHNYFLSGDSLLRQSKSDQ